MEKEETEGSRDHQLGAGALYDLTVALQGLRGDHAARVAVQGREGKGVGGRGVLGKVGLARSQSNPTRTPLPPL